MDLFFLKSAVIFYLLGSLGYLVFVLIPSRIKPLWGFMLTVAAFALHSLSILHRAIFSQYFPLTTLTDALSLFGWIVILLLLVMRHRDPSPIFGAIAAPMAAVLCGLAVAFSYRIAPPTAPVLRTWWLPMHVFLALVAYGFFALAAIAGMMYILQESFIKAKRLGPMYRLLPSLITLDDINRLAIPIGFFLHTVATVSGMLWAHRAWGAYWSWDPKEILTLVTWFLYAIVVYQRFRFGSRGRKAAIAALIGFALVIFTMIGVNLFLGGHHAGIGGTSFRGSGI